MKNQRLSPKIISRKIARFTDGTVWRIKQNAERYSHKEILSWKTLSNSCEMFTYKWLMDSEMVLIDLTQNWLSRQSAYLLKNILLGCINTRNKRKDRINNYLRKLTDFSKNKLQVFLIII